MKKLIYTILLITLYATAYSQVSLSPNGSEIKGNVSISDYNTNAAQSAILDINSTSKGVRMPVMTSNQRKAISSPAKGLMVFDSDYLTLFLYDGYNWYPLAKTYTQNLPALSRFPNTLVNGDKFGSSVAINDEIIVTGAPNDNSSRGAAYIYQKAGGGWNLKAKILANDAQANDLFGCTVLVKNNLIFVAAKGKNSNTGAVYIFEKAGENWQQKQKIIANNGQNGDNFGHSISVNNYNHIAIGAVGRNTSQGIVYTFSYNGSNWTQQATITETNGNPYYQFGFSIALEGNLMAISAPYKNNSAGEVYLFQQNYDGTWTEKEKLATLFPRDGALFGYSMSFSNGYIAISSPYGTQQFGGFVELFKNYGSYWGIATTIRDVHANAKFGSSVQMEGNYIIVGAENTDINNISGKGCAYVFFKTNSNGHPDWEILRRIYANDESSDNLFGQSVGLSNGNYVVGQSTRNNNKGEIYMGKVE